MYEEERFLFQAALVLRKTLATERSTGAEELQVGKAYVKTKAFSNVQSACLGPL